VKNAADFRVEDNTKRDRLEILFEEIGLPYDRPDRLTARDIVDKTPRFLDIVKRKGDLPCALRLIPAKPELPKLRQRGKTLNEYLNGWFKELDINPDDYKAEVVPHSEITLFSTIFLITDQGIWGDIIADSHWHLSQGIYETEPVAFFYDFKNWIWSREEKEAQKCMEQAIEMLKVEKEKQTALKNKLNSEFTPQGYLKGYFEFIVWPQIGISFIDYNRLLHKILGDRIPTINPAQSGLSGTCASPGQARGPAKIVLDPKTAEFNTGDILVCPMTMVDYVPLMQKSAGIITEQGNLLSHAAIVSRELKKPCLIGVKEATKKIKNGQIIQLDADAGTVQIIA